MQYLRSWHDFEPGRSRVCAERNDSGKSRVSKEEIVDNVGALLCTKSAALHSTLLKRSITAGSESYTIPLNAKQASDIHEALALARARTNKAIRSSKNVKTHTDLLDIFGFESLTRTASSSCASTMPTRSCSRSSTVTCLRMCSKSTWMKAFR
uniref:Uncharacterized protein n=1 Tax=Hyaloperonospora arabidopsidis (strain Emoy2) TaxID=559515 RepID=M4C6B2_HYAAE